MNTILNALKPAPILTEIEDKEEVKSLYHYWRIRTLYSMFVGYALYYFTRKSFTFAMPGLIAEGYDTCDLGLLASIFALAYGLSKFTSGILSDQANPRYFMAIGLFLTGVLNILFGFSSSLYMFALFWGLNGWFQGFGWPACARLLTHWYSHSERGSWWSTWNASHNIGAFLIPWIVGLSFMYFDWRYGMYIPGVICILGSFFLANRLRDTPESLGLPTIEKFRNDYGTKNDTEENQQISTREILVEHILKNRYMWMLAFAYFFVYVVRQGVNDWTVVYLTQFKGYSILGASGCVSFFEIGGVFGSLAAGWGSDRLFGARRGPVNVIFTLATAASIFFFWYLPNGYPWLDFVAIFMIGFAIFGPQMMIGIAAAELSHKKAASTSTGFVGTFAYIGAAVAGWPLGKVTQVWGWDGYFWFMGICCIISLAFLIPMWSITENRKAAKSKVQYA